MMARSAPQYELCPLFVCELSPSALNRASAGLHGLGNARELIREVFLVPPSDVHSPVASGGAATSFFVRRFIELSTHSSNTRCPVLVGARVADRAETARSAMPVRSVAAPPRARKNSLSASSSMAMAAVLVVNPKGAKNSRTSRSNFATFLYSSCKPML